MRLADGRGTLGYCLNVHPTQTLAEVRAALLGPVRTIARRLCPAEPFAVGLRLSAEAAARPDAATELAAIFAGEGFAAYTMNGFPYGPFHGVPVKEAVYEPDWTTPDRLAYTLDLARIMAALVPPKETATISTVPGGFAPRTRSREAAVAEGLLRAAAGLVRLERETGRRVALALEPEPFCLLETTAEAVAFFGGHLFTPSAAERLAELTGLGPDDAAAALPRHLGLCLDACHMAVMFEEPEATLSALDSAGIPIHKMQISAALRIPRLDADARRRAAAFHDGVYLHQTMARRAGGTVLRALDLPQALERGAAADGEEWRIHVHVPLFAEPAPPLASTADSLERLLSLHRNRPFTSHLEVETYTWSVLPPELGGIDVTAGIEKELRWVLQRLG
ncbi:metabolite traffic protein EboE [Azospirillum sp. HJ39]|uniref:metabolite traffic protein EboE n=1 Tax=Azospirillum sp. HJ39 TaxID=3159496 RepID=UPI0035590A41